MLLPIDYTFQIRNEIKEMLQRGDTYKLQRAEKAALDQMRSYLLKRYHVDRIFKPISAYNPSKHYTEDEFCHYTPEENESETTRVYRCSFECQGIEPNEVNFWQADDPRNAMLVMYLVDMTLYHLYASQTTRQTPEHRSQRYEDALDWLKDVRDSKIEADLPRKEELKQDDFHFRFGSYPKRQQRY